MFEVISPCKINLFLYITGKRLDGFHDLQSLFCLLDHGDKMGFDLRLDDKGEINIHPDMGFPVKDNLIYKAARLMQEYTGTYFSLDVNIDKVLPMGGGLGGGSSNAATTLLVINTLGHFEITLNNLALLSERLGSDVPFFVHGQNAYVEGRGEVVIPYTLPQKYYLVVTPPCHVSTKDVFNDAELPEYFSVHRSLDVLMHAPFSNDCLAVVRKKYCEIGHTLDCLLKYGGAAMSGTGASCFTAFDSYDQALQAQDEISRLLGSDYQSFVASSTNLSPVHRQLAKIQAQ